MPVSETIKNTMPLQHIIFRGEDEHNMNASIYRAALEDALDEYIGEDSYVVYDGAEVGISSDTMRQVLTHKSGPDTHIHFWGHGAVIEPNGYHAIVVQNQDRYTADLLAENRDIPGIRHIWSCYAGAAWSAVYALGANKPLILHSGKRYGVLDDISMETIVGLAQFSQNLQENYQKTMNAYDAFEHSLVSSPETSIFVELTENNELAWFKACAPRHFIGKDDVKYYLELQIYAFRNVRRAILGHQEQDFIPIEELLTDMAVERYMELALIVECARGIDSSRYGLEYVSNYLNAGVNPNCSVWNGTAPLKAACDGTDSRVVELLLQRGALVNQWDINNLTPLSLASVEGTLETMEVLLRYGADVNALSCIEITLLHQFCVTGDIEKAKLLLSYGARTDIENDKGLTPRQVAIQARHWEVATVIDMEIKKREQAAIEESGLNTRKRKALTQILDDEKMPEAKKRCLNRDDRDDITSSR